MAKLEIASIQNDLLQTIARNVDHNHDGVLKKEEYSLFTQQATGFGVDYKTINETLNLNAFQRWIHDVDKVCTDGKDDGKLGFGETMESFGKGLAGLVKGAINKPITTAVTVAVGAAAVALTSGAILPFMVAAGVTMGAGMIGVGAYKAAKADTDAEAKQAWETIGTGTFAVGASALGAKTALKQANAAGVKNAIATNNPIKNVVNCFKSAPRSLRVSGWHIDSKFVIAGIHKDVNNYIKDIAQNPREITPEMKATVKQLRDDEATIVNGIKKSINDGYYVRPEKYEGRWHTNRMMSVQKSHIKHPKFTTGHWDDLVTVERKSFSGIANHYRDVDFAALAKENAIVRIENLVYGEDNIGGIKLQLNTKKPIQRYYATQKIENLALEAGKSPEVCLKDLNDQIMFEQSILNRIKSNTKELMNIK